MPTSGDTKNVYIPGFDGLRAIAIFMVLCDHNGFPERMYWGAQGVWLFFILSGFLIVRILLRSRQDMEAGLISFGDALKRFYWRRTLRIFPAYFGFLAVLQLVWPQTIHCALYFWTYTTNLYAGYVLHAPVKFYGHLWSLAVEEQFYVVFSLLLLSSRTKYFLRIMTGILIASLMWKAVLWGQGAASYTIYYDSLVNFGLLAAGGVAGICADRFCCRPSFAYLLMGSYVAILPILYLYGDLSSYNLQQIVSPIFAVFLVLSVYKNPASLLVRALEYPGVRYLGKISYGFYLYHPLFSLGEASHGTATEKIALTAIAFISTLVVASLSFHFYEQPFLRLKNRKFSRHFLPS